jgi:hypothetical protein
LPSGVRLVKIGQRVYSDHCDEAQRDLLDALLKESTVEIDTKKFRKNMACIISVLTDSVYPNDSVSSEMCTSQQKACFALNSHEALSDKRSSTYHLFDKQLSSLKPLFNNTAFTNDLSLEKFSSGKSYPDETFLDKFFEENGFEGYRPSSEVNNLNCFLHLLKNPDTKKLSACDNFSQVGFFKSLLKNPKVCYFGKNSREESRGSR